MTLIARLESATQGSRELDAMIYGTINPKRSFRSFRFEGVPHYTTSVDAALTLVPEGMRWTCGFSNHVPHNAQVWTSTGFYEGECDSNRAIALCIAALKAREE